MNIRNTSLPLLAVLSLSAELFAGELPRLPRDVDPGKQTYREQKQLADLPEAYVSTSPEDLGDGLHVGTLDLPGTEAAVEALVADDKAGKFQNLDSLLLWKDGKLIFEMYNRGGRVDGPHYAMSVTKTLTSVTLARAIQLGLLSMNDLDKPVISFMPEIDRSKIQRGVETITLRDALFMKSGLRFEEKNYAWKLGAQYSRQQYFQKLFQNTAPVTPTTKEYKYTGTDPSMIMMIVDIKAQSSRHYGTAQEFIAKEVAGKFGAIYNWDDQGCGIPKCGAGSHFTSRSLVKIGIAIIQGGRYNGEQLLSPEYVKLIMDTSKGQGYFYFFHNRSKGVANGKINFISGIGAGGQYMATFPDLNLVMVATADNKKGIGLPLQAAMEHLIPLFEKRSVRSTVETRVGTHVWRRHVRLLMRILLAKQHDLPPAFVRLGKELYRKDGSHPSAKGAYLATICFYVCLFNADPENVRYNGELSVDVARKLRAAVTDTMKQQ